jgi:esterase/lipase superfamily enzyme
MTTLTGLLAQLEAAVRAGDRAQAQALLRQAQQMLVKASHDLAAAERRVQALQQALEQPAAAAAPEVKLRDVLGTERGIGINSIKGDRGTVFPVWFGTNRKPDGRGGFGTARHDRTTRGRADVYVPEGHRFGEIGTPFWKKLLRFDLRDDTLRLQQLSTLSHEAWLTEVQQTLRDAEAAGEPSHALVFIHGFNVDFEEAAIRAAQIGLDLAVPGATAFFSWPSRGNVVDYPVDEASIEASEQAITDFLVDFATRCGAQKVHLIAHSMGNRGLLRALQRIAANAQTRGQVKFGQIFLAAPDVDSDLFLNLAALYTEHSERTTLYASDGDMPVHLSSKLHDAARAGYFKPYTAAPGIDTIAVPDFDLDMLGHSYFAQAEALLTHMRDLMLNGKATVSGHRLKPATEDGLNFWKLKR